MLLAAPIGEKVFIHTTEEEEIEAIVHGFSEKGWLIYDAKGNLWGRELEKPDDCVKWNPEKEPFLQMRSAVFFPDYVFETADGKLIESRDCDWKMLPGAKNEIEQKQKAYKELILKRVKEKLKKHSKK